MSSIKSKLTALLLVIGIVPLVITAAISCINTVNSAFDFSEHEMKVQNELIKKEVSAMMSGNFTALRVLAVNPSVEEFLTVAPEQRDPNAKSIVQNVNSLFHDDSNIIIADSTGQQLVRSDNSKLVSVTSRDYFQAAMKGDEYVSDVIVSKTTGLAIVVIEVPVKNSSGKVIGMIQRNYNISTLADFLKKEADAETELAIFESSGKLVAHSSFQIAKTSYEKSR